MRMLHTKLEDNFYLTLLFVTYNVRDNMCAYQYIRFTKHSNILIVLLADIEKQLN